VDGVDLTLRRGEVLGIVGESGCGKSVTALSILRVVPKPGKVVDGEVLFEGSNLLQLPVPSMQQVRGNSISMIFQEPMTSLNPVFTIGHQIMEVFAAHQGLERKQSREKAIEMLQKVGIPSPENRAHDYPHQLSGGMRQRVMIAMALVCNPQLLIADEPTTALDVTIQAQIVDLMLGLKSEFKMAIILITHNLGLVAEMAERVAVMYAGRILEEAGVEALFNEPFHPYTLGLLASVPRIDRVRAGRQHRLQEIAGIVPSLTDLPQGCKFFPRCSLAIQQCPEEEPPLVEIKEGHFVRCWLKTLR
jgi:oligopeptide/dipeptide ABC transporter ATP-binding protein